MAPWCSDVHNLTQQSLNSGSTRVQILLTTCRELSQPSRKNIYSSASSFVFYIPLFVILLLSFYILVCKVCGHLIGDHSFSTYAKLHPYILDAHTLIDCERQLLRLVLKSAPFFGQKELPRIRYFYTTNIIISQKFIYLQEHNKTISFLKAYQYQIFRLHF